MGQLACKQPDLYISRTSLIEPKTPTAKSLKDPFPVEILLKKHKKQARPDEASTAIQRTWRSLRARKRFALLLPTMPYDYLDFQELSETLGPKPVVNTVERKPMVVYSSGGFYSGYWKGGFRDRKGLMVWPDGAFYEGEWHLGRMSGTGHISLPEGVDFTGTWTKYKQQSRQGPHSDGYAWLWFQCKLREMKLLKPTDDDKMRAIDLLFSKFDRLKEENSSVLAKISEVLGHVRCQTVTLPDGTTYEGQVKKGLREGLGRLSNKRGILYEGMWKQDSRHGVGRAINHQDGSVFEGTFVEGFREGFGASHWPNTNKYTGMWQNDRMQGIGEFYWCSERTYRGEWAGGHQSGFGVLTDRFTRRVGSWSRGRLC